MYHETLLLLSDTLQDKWGRLESGLNFNYSAVKDGLELEETRKAVLSFLLHELPENQLEILDLQEQIEFRKKLLLIVEKDISQTYVARTFCNTLISDISNVYHLLICYIRTIGFDGLDYDYNIKDKYLENGIVTREKFLKFYLDLEEAKHAENQSILW